MLPIAKIGAADGIIFHDIGAKESDELRTQSREERADAFLYNVTFDSGLDVSVRMIHSVHCDRAWNYKPPLRAAPEPQVVVTPPDHPQRRSAYIPQNVINSVSPLNVSEKRHPLGDPKPLSPTLESSTERVATGPRRSLDGSLRGTPATITSEVADIWIGSAVEENREQREVLSPQSATAAGTDRCAQADREEFRASSQKNAEKSTSKSEPKLDPEPLPIAASDGSDELRTQSRKERPDAFLVNASVHSGFKTSALPALEAAPVPQVVITPPDHSQRRSAYILPNATNSVSPPDDTRNEHTSDGEHTGCCIICGFKLL
ncbi:hypothetical protein EDD15DRAFT_754127 [Pisolithus albus]|nr:hypothetical protein EDD15DRAFT_754127 [Pisolithus albus]